ncbi:MAG: integration host factor subunit beta [Mariprofundus sp.]|nr:integration host factor subunit beta [Mariprofundus sp.]
MLYALVWLESVMTKSELVEMIAEQREGITRREAEIVMNTILSVIGDALADGNHVELRGFGSFITKARNARVGRNPKTGDAVMIPAKIVPHFKPGKNLRERVDSQV